MVAFPSGTLFECGNLGSVKGQKTMYRMILDAVDGSNYSAHNGALKSLHKLYSERFDIPGYQKIWRNVVELGAYAAYVKSIEKEGQTPKIYLMRVISVDLLLPESNILNTERSE